MDSTNLEFELEGTIYLIERDDKGNILSRDPIDGQGFMQIFAKTIPYILESNYLNNILDDLEEGP